MQISSLHDTVVARLSGNKVLVAREETRKSEEELARLKQRDSDVRTHEASHLSDPRLIAAQGPHFIYQIGPDGRPYAIGGSVALALPRAESKTEALNNALALKKSAASSEPSPQDGAASAAAYSMINEALSRPEREHTVDTLA